MAVAAAGFRWLDILEKEFDKAVVDLDFLFGDMVFEEVELASLGRVRLASLVSCFSQLTHKAQTVFQTNAKLEAELINMREELIDAEAKSVASERQHAVLLKQLHASQLQLHSLRNGPADAEAILFKLELEMFRAKQIMAHEEKIKETAVQLKKENDKLRAYATALHGDLFGARLAAKYLDKELAGRIQQMQLLGREMRPDVRDKLWEQLEAEIHLHRHKVVIKACQVHQQSKKKSQNEETPSLHSSDVGSASCTSSPSDSSSSNRGSGPVRVVTIFRENHEGLGMSITGGREHGVPILISELHNDSPSSRCQQLNVGDAVLSVNDKDLREVFHQDAVQILSQLTGNITLNVQYISPGESDEEDDLTGEHAFEYPFFTEEDQKPSGTTASSEDIPNAAPMTSS